MLNTYCYKYEKDWDKEVHLVLFAAQEALQESLGLSHFELVFCHTVRRSFEVGEGKVADWDSDLLDYMSDFIEKLFNAFKLAQENLKFLIKNESVIWQKC